MNGPAPPAGRFVALDVARCLALLGMVATHVVAARDADGSLSAAQWLAGGRASALFAVLAGVTIALATGGPTPYAGRERWARCAGLAARALLVAVLGLALGVPDSGLAVILTYYGVLFVLGLPFVALRTPALLGLAAVWAVTAPVLSHLLRPHLPERGFDSPQPTDLAEPGRLLAELLFTGYYPGIAWLALLLLGMAIGRTDLTRRGVALALTGGGLALAVAATLVSQALTARPDVVEALLRGRWETTGPEVLDAVATGMSGTTPTGGAWQWLLVVAPHSGTPFDLAQTGGSAAAVIGLCLLVVRALPETAVVALRVVAGAGTMTLSLYALHILLRTEALWPPDEGSFHWHALVLLAIGAGYVAAGRRGPLERAVGHLSGAVADRVRRPAAVSARGPE
ncbi:DUF1624 domain-containing protein [Nocardioides sp. dk4132]|uniref:heparan-alpha-glucosaminide N-acetyltransferase domain-containing protein n=1 Tax=unclassified Nocardioides TaxID=2615069 RepID=UPI0012974580|nr:MULTISPECIES: heparan-alpha-glucosaminide N-acetyltransferase domain-containing protein [unclassified Nocardioides]MQW75873.1 DUF1624 domain-containing protein [Nocardioides sp. dk4132]QGA08738.1 DUF1624 domain-containing protein [Nocardioides sp. dk884]